MKIFAFALMLLTASVHAESLLKPQGKADALLPVDEAFQFEGASKKAGVIALNWTIAPGYYLYSHMLKVSVDAPANVPSPMPQLPKGESKHDEDFGDVITYRTSLRVPLTFATNAASPGTLRVRYQGCADIGVCYPPQTRLVAIK